MQISTPPIRALVSHTPCNNFLILAHLLLELKESTGRPQYDAFRDYDGISASLRLSPQTNAVIRP